jgi:hypothetical protein
MNAMIPLSARRHVNAALTGSHARAGRARRAPAIGRAATAVAAAAVLYLSIGLLASAPASAHLAIIRQGPESAGSLESGDLTGTALAAGDYNADGWEDLAIGSPGEEYLGVSNVGVVLVVYGTRFGLTDIGGIFRAPSTLGWTNVPGASFGTALAAGDFDGDGDDDLAIGAPLDSAGTSTNPGAVYVVKGGPTGLGSSAIRLLQNQAGGTNEANDEFGAQLCAGNFNGDASPTGNPYEDLAIGVPGEDSDAGAVFHFYGSGTGITATGSGWFKQSSIGGTNVAFDRFGDALAAGNLYGSSHDDLAAGAHGRDLPGASNAGVVYLISGSASGLTSAGSLQYSASDHDDVQEMGLFGYTLAVGQFSADPYKSLAIAEPGRTIGGFVIAGRVLATHGSLGGLDWSATEAVELNQDMASSEAEANEYFGLALASGDWDDDGDDDLAIGTPRENFPGLLDDAGLVNIFMGSASGLTAAGSLTYWQEILYDASETGDQLGYALAFGRFDSSGRASLAAGAPNEATSNDIVNDAASRDIEEFSYAGAVYVIAPWRQPVLTEAPTWRSSIATDCFGSPVFSQRMHDRVRPASTTKVMTLLLACEAIEAGTADSDFVYDADWVGNITGTTEDMVNGEAWNLMDLMCYTIYRSGNDGAYAVADIVSYAGDAPANDVSLFVELMNERAESLGMTRTQFSNPAGKDAPEDDGAPIQDNYTTAADMARLGRAAMQNALFRKIMGEASRTSIIDAGTADADTVIHNRTFVTTLQRSLAEANGIKTGHTTMAGRSRLASAEEGPGELVVAGLFSIHHDLPISDLLYTVLAEYLELAMTNCDPPIDPDPVGPFVGDPFMNLGNLGTWEGSSNGGGTETESSEDTTIVQVVRDSGNDPVAFDLEINRGWSTRVLQGEVASFSAAPLQRHSGLRIANANDTPATFFLSVSHPPIAQSFSLPPGETLAIPGYNGPQAPLFSLAIQNASPLPTAFEIVCEGFVYSITYAPGDDGPAQAVFGDGTTGSRPPTSGQSLRVRVVGHSTSSGNTVAVIVRPPYVGTDVSEPVGGAMTLVAASPNPFRDRAVIALDLRREGLVEAEIFDVTGRRVRKFEPVHAGVGRLRIEWNGADDREHRLAAGVYLYRLTIDGRHGARGKLTLMR